MRNSYDELISKLKKEEKVPKNLFNKVAFTIQNNKAKNCKVYNKFYFVAGPVVTSIMIFVLFIGFSSVNSKKQTEEFLLAMYDQSNYDKFFIDINEDYLF